MTDRPKRRAIPLAIKRVVGARQNWLCGCGCGDFVTLIPHMGTEWDHYPALRLRDIAPDGKDYVPPQHSPDHIVARCRDSHRRKTSGSGATTAGSDIGAIKKERKRDRPPKPKRIWPTRKLQGRGFEKRVK